MTSRGSTSLNQVALTNAYTRESRCGVAGCGKDREDPIHQVAD